MSDPGKGHVSLSLLDLNKNFLTDPAHIPRIQERFSRDRVEPVELSKPILDRMIGCSSGTVKDQPSLSFVAFDLELDSALLFVSQNGECLVVPTHEDGSSNFLEQLSLLPKLLKIPDIDISLSSHEALELFQRLQPTDVCTKSKELVPRTEEDTARTNPSNQEASAPGQGLQEATIVSSTLEQHHQEEEEAQTDVSVEFTEVVARAEEDTAKTSLSNQEAPEPSQGLQLDAIDSNQEAPKPSQRLQLDAIDSILRHQKEEEVDLLWKQLEALAKAVEENGRKEDSNGQLSGDELKHGSMDSHPQLHIQTVRTSLSSQEASELFQRLQLAAIDSSILGHHQDAQISALWNALFNELYKARAIKDCMKVVTHVAGFTGYGGKQLVSAYLQGKQLAKKITAVLDNLGQFVLSVQDCMKVVTHVVGFTGYGGKQLVSACLQGEQLAKTIAAVLVQLEKSGQFVLSDQDRMKLVTHVVGFTDYGGKQLVLAYLQGERRLQQKITTVLEKSGRFVLSDQDWMNVADYGGKQLMSAYLQGKQLAKIVPVLVQLVKSGQFVLSVQEEAMSVLEKRYVANLTQVVLDKKLQTDTVCNSLSQMFSDSDRAAPIDWPSKESQNCHADVVPMQEECITCLKPQSLLYATLNLSDIARTNLSSQEASETTQGLQQINTAISMECRRLLDEANMCARNLDLLTKASADQKTVSEQLNCATEIPDYFGIVCHGHAMDSAIHIPACLEENPIIKTIPPFFTAMENPTRVLLFEQGSFGLNAHTAQIILLDSPAEPLKTEKAKEEQEKELSERDARIRQTLLNWLMLNGMRNLKRFHEYYCDTLGGNYTCEDQSSIVQQSRRMGFLQRAYQILNKEQSNKNITDINEIKMLFDNCVQLKETFVEQNIDRLAVDRKYKEAYNTVRESFGNIRRNVERWRDAVLHSVVPWFQKGAFNSNVRKLMSRGLARFGKGGNGELVEAFQSGERLVIKQTLLRESEWSIVTQMDHPNVMPWLALICGDRSDTKPGQIVSYQVMPKMTEDLSVAIRKMGGSIHHYILQLQEAEEPNSVLSAKADLVRQRGAEILRGTLQGLDYMHRQNLVHRDIKASNILLKRPVDCPHETVHTCTCQERWEVRVADFDSVIHLPVARDRAQRRKQLKVGNTGTSGYRAPEVFFESCTSDTDAKDYYSPASDIWSFGAVCLHLAMGFCCPRHQYQVGLIMLSRHNLVNIPSEEAQEKVDRTVGMYHIRQGFTGEKWQNMINFTARPLEVDWSKRPSAETLLKDPFVKPDTTLNSSQTVTTTKDDKNVQRHQELSLDRNESSR